MPGEARRRQGGSGLAAAAVGKAAILEALAWTTASSALPPSSRVWQATAAASEKLPSPAQVETATWSRADGRPVGVDITDSATIARSRPRKAGTQRRCQGDMKKLGQAARASTGLWKSDKRDADRIRVS